MRRAEVSRAWDRAATRDRKFDAVQLTIEAKPPLADTTDDLPRGITVVGGLNGVGKTTLLRLTMAALGQDARLRDALVQDGSFEISLQADDVEVATPLDAQAGISVTLLDAATDCARLIDLARQPNFEDLLEGTDPRHWTENEIADARFVVGKRYSSVSLTEFEAPTSSPPGGSDDDTVLPFIEVEELGVVYDFRSMGQGELAALVLLWRIRRLEGRTVVLLEEPETYLAAKASAALVSVLARVVDEKRLYAFVTTHSPGVMRQAPLQAVRILVAGDEGAVLRAPSSHVELDALLDLPAAPARLVLVEDAMAFDFVRELLARYGGAWVGATVVLWTGGLEAIVDICRKLPTTEQLRLVGVLDGDQQLPEPGVWPVYRLPGPEDPDRLLLTALLADLATFASLCGRPPEFVTTAVSICEGVEPHDWFIEFARQVGLDVHAVRRHAVAVWLLVAENEASAVDLVSAVTQSLSAPSEMIAARD